MCTVAHDVGHELMRDVKFVGVGPIASHQEPPGKPRLHEMEARACGRLCQLSTRGG
jgi:hypothetical protein